METISGTLFGYFETGVEGILWALQRDGVSGYEGLVVLERGDHLRIYDADKKVVFDGIINPNTDIGVHRRPNTTISQPVALGRWIHWTQDGFEPDVWANYFISKRYTGLLQRDATTPK